MYLCYSTTSFPCFIALTVGCYLSFGLLSYSCRMLTVHIMCQPNAMFQHVVASTLASDASALTIQTARSAFFFCSWMALVGELPVYLGVFFFSFARSNYCCCHCVQLVGGCGSRRASAHLSAPCFSKLTKPKGKLVCRPAKGCFLIEDEFGVHSPWCDRLRSYKIKLNAGNL